MKPLKVFAVSVMVMFGLSLAGCCGTSSTTTKETEKVVVPSSSSPTLGDQLLDLQKAYEKGAISEKEYQEARQKLLESQGQGK